MSRDLKQKWCCSVAVCVVAGVVLSSGQEFNPFPRQLLRTEPLHQWSFQNGTAGWTALHQCKIETVGGVLKIQTSGNDPYLISGPIRVEGPLAVKLHAKCVGGGSGEFFWTTVESPNTSEERSQNFKLVHDGQWRDYAVRLGARGTVTRLRLDPGTAPGVVEVEKIELIREVLHPLEIMAVHATGRQVSLTLTNHTDKAISCAVAGRQMALGGNAAQVVTLSVGGEAPFEARDITVLSEGLPPLHRRAFMADAEAAGEWVERKSGNLVLKVARDGSGARVELGAKLVGFIAPLV
jgi:hypothetical protein